MALPPYDLYDVRSLLTEEERAIQDTVARFTDERVLPIIGDAFDQGRFPKELVSEIADLGLLGSSLPEQYGGHALNAVSYGLICQELERGDSGIRSFVSVQSSLCMYPIYAYGTEEQRLRWLPDMAAGKVIGCFGLTEPQGGSDPANMKTNARRDGGDWVLDGVKSLVARATECELFLVSAETGEGPALFVVESGAGGLSVEAEPAMGLRPAATGRLLLDGVRVPAAAVLGEGRVEDYVECVNRSRIAWCSLVVGTSQAVLDYVIPYVNERQAFGEPISNRQGVAFAVSDIGIETDGMRLVTYRAASRADRGDDFAREAALARRLCASKGMQIGSDGVQLLGGHGFVKEHPVERWYRDLRAAGVMEGALLV